MGWQDTKRIGMGEIMMDQIGIQTQGPFYSQILNQMSLLALIFEPV